MADAFAETSRRGLRAVRGRDLLLLGAALALTASVGSLTPVAAQDESAAETYAAQDESAAETYALLSAEIDRSARHNAHVERLLESQAESIAALESELGQLEGTVASLEPLAETMFGELAAFVEADAPFLAAERTERLDRLSDLMAEEGNVSEKFRRLLEAIQIELEYGRTLGTYSGVLEDGRLAQFAYVGRVALLYRTVDGRETGYWDRTSRTWVADRVHDRGIRDAIAMAKEEVAPDLLVLPVPAPSEARR